MDKKQKLWKCTLNHEGKETRELVELDINIDYLNKVKTKQLWYESYQPTFNILFLTNSGGINIMLLPEKKLKIILEYYNYGKGKFTISGTEYKIEGLNTLKIFTNEKNVDLDLFEKWCRQEGILGRNIGGPYFSEECFLKLGTDVTDNYIGDNPYGYANDTTAQFAVTNETFVNVKRIEELKQIKNEKFDLTRLVKLCEEINHNYNHGNYLSVGMLGRTILNHIPPIFNLKNFDEVASNCGGSSFKNSMQQLNGYFKNLADSYLHQHIRKKESIPNHTQVEFRAPLDVLLEKVNLELHNK